MRQKTWPITRAPHSHHVAHDGGHKHARNARTRMHNVYTQCAPQHSVQAALDAGVASQRHSAGARCAGRQPLGGAGASAVRGARGRGGIAAVHQHQPARAQHSGRGARARGGRAGQGAQAPIATTTQLTPAAGACAPPQLPTTSAPPPPAIAPCRPRTSCVSTSSFQAPSQYLPPLLYDLTTRQAAQ